MRLSVWAWGARAYVGYIKLWQVVWIGCVAMLLPLAMAVSTAKDWTVSAPDSWMPFVLLLLVWLYGVFLTVALWRCARNTPHLLAFWMGRLLSLSVGSVMLTATLLLVKESLPV